MRQRHTSAILLASALLATMVVAWPAHAQSKPGDPVTGKWSGYIGHSEASPSPAKMVLALMPDGTVSGNVAGPELQPGDIKGGTFDPKTGAIRFTVTLHDKGGSGGTVLFDGRLARDTASGKMTLSNDTGVFRFMREVAGAKTEAHLSGDPRAALRRSFVEVSDWVQRAANLVPPEKYSYRPTPAVRTFAQLVGHVIDGSQFYCGRAASHNVQWADVSEKGLTTKADLTRALQRAIADCIAAYDGDSQVGPLVDNVAHHSLHYGNMVTYLRMMGITPPSS